MSQKCSECPVKDMSKQFDLINSFVHSVTRWMREREINWERNLKKNKHYFAETFRLGSTVVSVLNLRIKQIKKTVYCQRWAAHCKLHKWYCVALLILNIWSVVYFYNSIPLSRLWLWPRTRLQKMHSLLVFVFKVNWRLGSKMVSLVQHSPFRLVLDFIGNLAKEIFGKILI